MLTGDFDLPANTLYEQLHQLLSERITYLLINDLTGLWNILYRIDVNERKLKLLFDQSNPAMIAPGITDLVFDRVKQKAESRIKYRSL